MALQPLAFPVETQLYPYSSPCILITGMRNTGRSSIALAILQGNGYLKYGKKVKVISPTDKYYPMYSSHLSCETVIDQLDPELLVQLIKQEEQFDVLVLDDCFDRKLPGELEHLSLNARHFGITIIIVCQDYHIFSPSFKSSFDYVFMTYTANIPAEERLYKQYAGIYPTFDSFKQVFQNNTTEYNSMVIDNTSRSYKLEDKVFQFNSSYLIGRIHDAETVLALVIVRQLVHNNRAVSIDGCGFLSRVINLPTYAFRTVCQYV